MNYKLNLNLLHLLPEHCRGGIIQSLEAADVNYLTWNRRLTERNANRPHHGPSVEHIIRFCNANRISIRFLFSPEDEPESFVSIPVLFHRSEPYEPCWFDWMAFKKAFGLRSPEKMAIPEMMKKMKMSKKPFQSWFDDGETLRVPALLLFCKTFNRDLFEFIIAPPLPNHDLPKEETPVEPAQEVEVSENDMWKSKYYKSRKELSALRKENKKLKDDKLRLGEKVVALNEQIEHLKRTILAMEGHVMYDSSGKNLMVAEKSEKSKER